jgi:hypothetical protein
MLAPSQPLPLPLPPLLLPLLLLLLLLLLLPLPLLLPPACEVMSCGQGVVLVRQCTSDHVGTLAGTMLLSCRHAAAIAHVTGQPASPRAQRLVTGTGVSLWKFGPLWLR